MPLNLYALCGNPGEVIIKRVMVSGDVQSQLEPFFIGVEQAFRAGVDQEIDFDGRWKPDRDQLMRIPVNVEASAIVDILAQDTLAIEALQAGNFEDEAIRALMVKEATGQTSRILIQYFSNLQRLSRRFAVTLHGDIFNRLSQPTFAIDAQIHVIIEGGYIKFKSYNMAKRILDLSGAYREATDQDIVALCNLPRLTGDADEIIAVANPTLRKLISSVKDSDVFDSNTAEEIQAKAAAVNLNLLVQNHRVVLPGEKSDLRKVLTFLDHGVYLSPVSNERYITNSRRALP
jgi:hypothetical protein